MLIQFKKTLRLFAGLTLFPLAFSVNAQNPGMTTKKRIEVALSPLSAAVQRAMISVVAGEYPIGYSEGSPDIRPAHFVTLRAFAIDKTEVTNAQFAEFLNALEFGVRADFSYSKAKKQHFSDESWPELLEMGTQADLYPLIGLDDDRLVLRFEMDNLLQPRDLRTIQLRNRHGEVHVITAPGGVNVYRARLSGKRWREG